MASKCIDDCVNVNDAVRVRSTTYANLYKWPEAEAEFVRSISRGGSSQRRTVVDGISCRQMYLRSYTFSRKEDTGGGGGGDDDVGDRRNDRKCLGGGRLVKRKKKKKKTAKKGSVTKGDKTTTSRRAFVYRLVRRWMSCVTATKVDVDH